MLITLVEKTKNRHIQFSLPSDVHTVNINFNSIMRIRNKNMYNKFNIMVLNWLD